MLQHASIMQPCFRSVSALPGPHARARMHVFPLPPAHPLTGALQYCCAERAEPQGIGSESVDHPSLHACLDESLVELDPPLGQPQIHHLQAHGYSTQARHSRRSNWLEQTVARPKRGIQRGGSCTVCTLSDEPVCNFPSPHSPAPGRWPQKRERLHIAPRVC